MLLLILISRFSFEGGPFTFSMSRTIPFVLQPIHQASTENHRLDAEEQQAAERNAFDVVFVLLSCGMEVKFFAQSLTANPDLNRVSCVLSASLSSPSRPVPSPFALFCSSVFSRVSMPCLAFLCRRRTLCVTSSLDRAGWAAGCNAEWDRMQCYAIGTGTTNPAHENGMDERMNG